MSPNTLPPSPVSAARATGTTETATSNSRLPEGTVQCMVRTRIPTRFGRDVYVHLYRNSLDDKEHLALVFGQAIRSRTVDAPVAGETADDRLTRGASLADPVADSRGPACNPRHASASPVPPAVAAVVAPAADSAVADEEAPRPEYPLVRLHSECFTGETISSVRCDCGDQLDEAMRLMALAGEGVVVYLRQEGRGIGLYEKLRAYNLQDQGHDTVAANLLLNHPADLRTYDVASLILVDLGVDKVRLLTNNPDKLEKITSVGIDVVTRVGMVPAHWTVKSRSGRRHRQPHGLAHVLSGKPHAVHDDDDDDEEDASGTESAVSDEAIAATPVYPEMEAYLRTKVERMRHIIDLSASPVKGSAVSSVTVAGVQQQI
ncbi:GTP cyclohydrolase II-domain-containing protein [Blastocladiella britannica]|nr:GTP cyclohydrolase II-domain-containing protein [Blastocladiella britannica]